MGYDSLCWISYLPVYWRGIKFILVIILVVIKIFVAIVWQFFGCFCEVSLATLKLGKWVKNVFNQVKINIWKRWCLGLAVLPLYRNHAVAVEMSDFDDSFCKLDYVFLYYSTWRSLKAFCLLLGTANLRNNSLLVRSNSIVFTILCQGYFILKLIFIGVVLERSLEENSCSESFYKTGEVINEGFTSYYSCMASSVLRPA